MQQQIIDTQENMKAVEIINEDINYDLRDLEIFAARHCSDSNNKQRSSKQWLNRGQFWEEDRDYVLKYYADRAGVGHLYTTTHGRSVYGKHKPSPVTIMHWMNEKAKTDIESYIFRRYNKWNPAIIWDRNNTVVYHHSGQPPRDTFARQVSDMERDINLVRQAALQIITKHEEGNLAKSWGKVAIKWQEKLAIRSDGNMVIFKLVRSEDDASVLHLHVHRDHVE